MRQKVYISKTADGVYGFFTNGFLVVTVDPDRLPYTKEHAEKMVEMRLGDRFELDEDWNRTPTGEVRHTVWQTSCPFNDGKGCPTCRTHPDFKPRS